MLGMSPTNGGQLSGRGTMANDRMTRRSCLIGGLATAVLVGTMPAASRAQSDVIQSQDTNFGGIVGEITQCKRKDGVLTIKLRLRNSSGKDAKVELIDSRNFDSYYVTAKDKKYFVLRDTENTPLTPPADGFGKLSVKIAKDGSYTWWAKYPA